MPPIVQDKVRKPSAMRNSMQKTKQAKTSRSTKTATEDDKELNNVKITDY